MPILYLELLHLVEMSIVQFLHLLQILKGCVRKIPAVFTIYFGETKILDLSKTFTENWDSKRHLLELSHTRQQI